MTLLPLLLVAAAAAPKSHPLSMPKSRPYDALHYRIELRLKDEGAFESKVQIKLKPSKALPEIELDAYGLVFTSAAVDGASATHELKEDAALRTGTLKIKPPKPLAAGKEAMVELSYTGKAGTMHQGFFSAKDPEDPEGAPYYFTHFQPTYAH